MYSDNELAVYLTCHPGWVWGIAKSKTIATGYKVNYRIYCDINAVTLNSNRLKSVS